MKKFLIALPAFPNSKGFNHQTILVRAKDEFDAISIASWLKPGRKIGNVKEVNY